MPTQMLNAHEGIILNILSQLSYVNYSGALANQLQPSANSLLPENMPVQYRIQKLRNWIESIPPVPNLPLSGLDREQLY